MSRRRPLLVMWLIVASAIAAAVGVGVLAAALDRLRMG